MVVQKKMETLSDDLLGYIFLLLRDFPCALLFRQLSKRHNKIFLEWFWKPCKLILPSHIVYCVCDNCSCEDVKIISLPWYFMNTAPVYKFCIKKDCSRIIIRNLIRKALHNKYKIVIGKPFVQSFCTFTHKHIQVDAYASNSCVFYRNRIPHVLLFYGSPLIPLSTMHMRMTNPLIQKFIKRQPMFLKFL